MITARSSGTTYVSTAYGYDQASRLQAVTDRTYGATYAYFANSSLVDSLTFRQGTSTRMTTSRQYDFLGRLRSIVNTPTGAGQLPVSATYDYNAANQRTKNLQADGSYWVYEYDSLGQVNSGKKYWNDQTLVPGQQIEYGFDDIGNRSSTKAGGDANGSNLRTAAYTPNALNQYSQRTVPGGFDLLGLATASATVTVNSSPADYRKGEYFQKGWSVINTSAAVWTNVTITAGGTPTAGNQFVAKTPEVYVYDLDGNTTQDGRWTNIWDGENRLLTMESLASAPSGS